MNCERVGKLLSKRGDGKTRKKVKKIKLNIIKNFFFNVRRTARKSTSSAS